MPRVAMVKSESGIYHIIIRGINRQTLFEDEEDSTKFIQTLQKYREISKYKLYAYCLMSNHLHLLLMEDKEPLETVVRRICGSYVLWYNRKYGRVGYLFQDRFKSEPVEEDEYFLTVLRYIFQNPLKAGIVNKIENYKWTNYNDYIEKSKNTDIEYVLNIFNTHPFNKKEICKKIQQHDAIIIKLAMTIIFFVLCRYNQQREFYLLKYFWQLGGGRIYINRLMQMDFIFFNK